MKVIGIVGGMGAGKSTVIAILNELKPVSYISADLIGHEITLIADAQYNDYNEDVRLNVRKIVKIIWNILLFVDLYYGYSNNVSFVLHIVCAIVWDICAIVWITRYLKSKKSTTE